MIPIISHFAKTLKRLDLHSKYIGMFIVNVYTWTINRQKELK
jgi:hypothetical protein